MEETVSEEEASKMEGELGGQPIDGPRRVVLPQIAKTIMQAIRSALPELYFLWLDPVASPEIRKRDLAVIELLLQRLELALPERARRQHLTLLRCDRSDLTLLGSGCKIF